MSPTPTPRALRPGATLPLLDHADTLPFPERMWWLADHARSLSPHDYGRLHAALDASTDHARHVGLHLAVARRDLAAVAAALHDPVLRHRALAAAIRLPIPDTALTSVLDDAPQAVRFAVYGVLRRSRREALADELVAVVHERHGAVDVARLLPSCSPATIAHWLPRTPVPRAALIGLARVAPDAVLDHLVERFAGLDNAWPHRQRHAGLLTVLVERAPHRTLAVLRDHRGIGPGRRETGVLTGLLARPTLLLDQGVPPAHQAFSLARLPARVRRAMAALDQAQAVALVRSLDLRVDPALVLGAVRPEFRRAALDAIHPGDRLVEDVRVVELLTLPESDRVDLARRVLAHDRADRRGTRLEATAALTYAEAREPLMTATGSHRFQERLLAWQGLLACAGRERDSLAVVDALVDLLGRLASDPRSTVGIPVPVGVKRRLWSAVRADHPTALRLAAVPELDDLVGDLALGGDAEAVRGWIAASATREARAARLVAHDPALGGLPEVWHVVANRRTDLVDRLLDGGGPLPAIGRRWTEEQRVKANALAAAVAADEHAGLWDRVAAAKTVTDPEALARLAETAPEPIAVAALATPDPDVREAAR